MIAVGITSASLLISLLISRMKSDDIRPICISGPSGVGKGTLIEKLLKQYPSKMAFAISHTTRDPRGKEISGVEYHFIKHDEFEASIKNGDFIEYANVHGKYYGHSTAPIKAIQAKGMIPILDIDVQGAAQVKKHPGVNPIFFFITAPSMDELEKRLRGRGTETEEQIQKRLVNAKKEIAFGQENLGIIFDYSISNDEIDSTVKVVVDIISKNIKKL